jgi:hypothetical protein
MAELERFRPVSNFTFKMVEGRYECRGDIYYDDEHDQVPEPSLQTAALKLREQLKSEGHEFEIVFGDKGWIELYPQN